MRIAALLLSGMVVFAGSGCALVVASAGAVSTVTAASVKTAGKVTATTIKTTGRVASSAMSSTGEVTALSLESATQLARTGMVVLVDSGSGAVVELPWREGMQLYRAVQTGRPGVDFRMARVLRGGRWLNADLKKIRHGGADVAVWPRDVIELGR